MCRQRYIHVCMLRAIRARSLSLYKHVNGRREREGERRDRFVTGRWRFAEKEGGNDRAPQGSRSVSHDFYMGTFALHFASELMTWCKIERGCMRVIMMRATTRCNAT